MWVEEAKLVLELLLKKGWWAVTQGTFKISVCTTWCGYVGRWRSGEGSLDQEEEGGQRKPRNRACEWSTEKSGGREKMQPVRRAQLLQIEAFHPECLLGWHSTALRLSGRKAGGADRSVTTCCYGIYEGHLAPTESRMQGWFSEALLGFGPNRPVALPLQVPFEKCRTLGLYCCS